MSDKEEIFIKYANANLKENPANLAEILKLVFEERLDGEPIDFDEVTNLICELRKHKDLKEFPSWTKTLVTDGKLGLLWTSISHRLAFHTVTGWRIMAIPGEGHDTPCPYQYYDDFIHEQCRDGFVLKCYECIYLRFIDVLEQIISGKEYSETRGLGPVLAGASAKVGTPLFYIYRASRGENAYKQVIVRREVYLPKEVPVPLDINKALFNTVSHSLTLFILNNDRRKLKRCPTCNNFFIGKADPRHKYCSDCSPIDKRSREKKNEYQRKRRAKIREQKKKQYLTQEVRELIEDWMKDNKWTEEEAWAAFRADQEM